VREFPAYNPKEDGNVFKWILLSAFRVRELRRIKANAIKETTAKPKRLDAAKVEN
jgi:hypothetical protein